MREGETFPRAWVVVTLAAVGSLVGIALGAGITLQRQGGLLGDPDSSTRMIADNTWVLAWAGLAGGVGWTVGCLLGWRLAPRATPPGAIASWMLRGLAVAIVVAAVIAVLGVPSAQEVRSSDTNVGYDVSSLVWIVVVDTAIAVAALVLLSRRKRTGSSLLVVCAALALIAVGVAAVPVAALPAPDRAWLERWLAVRQAPLGAAPNLIVPASERCAPRSPDPFPDEDRSFSSDMPTVEYWINPWAPRWLPAGFGLDMERSWPWPHPHALWTDPGCREITLFTHMRRDEIAALGDFPPDVASWRLMPPTWCSDPSGCLEYRVVATIRGSDLETVVVLRTVGLSRAEADRVALSIPTDRARYI